MPPQPIEKPKIVYSSKIFKIKEQKIEYDDGEQDIFEICKKSPGVNTLAFNDKGELLIIKEHRFNHENPVWFLPAGKVENNQTFKQAAQQELREEGGYKANKIKLFREHSQGSTLDWNIKVFLAKNLESDSIKGDKGEEIVEKKFVSLDKAVEMALSDQFGSELISFNILRFNYLKEKEEIDF